MSLWLKNATNVLSDSLTLPGPTGGAYKLQHGQNLNSEKVIKILHGRLLQVGKTLTDYKFWAVNCTKCVWLLCSARSRTRWGSYSAPQTS